MSYTELRGAVLTIDGIAAAEVEVREDGGPNVRVWLDGSQPASTVEAELERVLASAGFRAPDPNAAAERDERPVELVASEDTASGPRKPNGNEAARRAGLGKGLDALIPAPDADAGPVPNRLEMIAIEESSAGTAVRAVDTGGRSAVAAVASDRALNHAVATTVAGLLGFGEAPEIRAVEVRQMAGSSVLVVIVEVEGKRAAGAAVIESGMPFALGTALWYAMRNLD